jgi:hypothetical protein
MQKRVVSFKASLDTTRSRAVDCDPEKTANSTIGVGVEEIRSAMKGGEHVECFEGGKLRAVTMSTILVHSAQNATSKKHCEPGLALQSLPWRNEHQKKRRTSFERESD